MAQEYVPPEYLATAFNCPHCGAFAHQRWSCDVRANNFDEEHWGTNLGFLNVSYCKRCDEFALWKGNCLIYPQMYVAPHPTADMPEDVKVDYEEARSIFAQSPRGAAALLRLAVQKLVIALGESGDNLNESIGDLVSKGLRVDIQRALDTVRVVGNNVVHPGVIDVNDNPEIALRLFKLINMIVEQMITQLKEIDELYKVLPEGAKDAIAKRDEQTKSQ